MRRTRLLWQLFPSFLLVTLLSLVAVSWYASRSLRALYVDTTRSDLRSLARVVKAQVGGPTAASRFSEVDSLCKRLGRESDTRVTVVLANGVVIGDTEEDPVRMENHADRPEIRAALASGEGYSVRYSTTLETDMMYVAVPVEANGAPTAVVRAAIPLSAIDAALSGVYRKIALAGLVTAVLAALVSLVISRRMSRPLEALRRAAQRFARGDLNGTLPTSSSEEIGGLSDAMKTMARQLDDRIRAIERQRNEEEAVLASMVESVVAVDTDERLIRVNRAAARLFDIDAPASVGKSLHEVVRNYELLRLVSEALKSDDPVEREVTLYDPEERFLQAHGTVLRGSNGDRIGALIVLNDVTRLRRLERVRRDFVANVSHELKTPITAIKGFVETLIGGAIGEREDAERFLAIVSTHTERLNAIIEDLLSLSRLEEGADQIDFEKTPVRDLVRRAAEACSAKAQSRNVRVDIGGERDIWVWGNAPLIEQAMVNLIDNAIKYSDEGGVVEVTLDRKPGECRIDVADHGCGIERKHLARIFERFYRADNARSRTLGGTGLGLAIVKHIVLAHGGRVSVESVPGSGSVFSITLPLA